MVFGLFYGLSTFVGLFYTEISLIMISNYTLSMLLYFPSCNIYFKSKYNSQLYNRKQIDLTQQWDS